MARTTRARKSAAAAARPRPTRLASLAAALLGGLASSSCCAVQLAANAAGWACLGFAALDPYRPAAAAATVLALAVAHVTTHRSWRVTLGAGVLAAALAGMPEAVERAGGAGGLGAAMRSAAAAVVAAGRTAPPPPPALTLRVDGIKCAACGERARAAVAGLPGVSGAAVDWRAGEVRLDSRGRGGAGPDMAAVEAALREQGFELRGTGDREL
jgi:hypothetical protein